MLQHANRIAEKNLACSATRLRKNKSCEGGLLVRRAREADRARARLGAPLAEDVPGVPIGQPVLLVAEAQRAGGAPHRHVARARLALGLPARVVAAGDLQRSHASLCASCTHENFLPVLCYEKARLLRDTYRCSRL